MLTWGLLIVAFCYDVVYELCDGLSVLPQIFMGILHPNGGILVFLYLFYLTFVFASILRLLDSKSSMAIKVD